MTNVHLCFTDLCISGQAEAVFSYDEHLLWLLVMPSFDRVLAMIVFSMVFVMMSIW